MLLYFVSQKVDQTTTKIAYMTAAMTSLANIHGITFSFVKSVGGKNELFQMFPTIKEQVSINVLLFDSPINEAYSVSTWMWKH